MLRAHRRIVLVGMSFDAPEGAPMLHPDGVPMRLVECPVVTRIAFWVPQRAPYRRRPVRPLLEYLATVRAPPPVLSGAAALVDLSASMTSEEYQRRHLLEITFPPEGYTMVADASKAELEALRAGVISEQIQDFTFDRQPSKDELRRHLLPHWDQRALAALGYVPNNVPKASAPAHVGFGGRGKRVTR